MTNIQQMTEDIKGLEWNLGVKYQDTDSMVLSLFALFKDTPRQLWRRILDRFIDENAEQLPTIEEFQKAVGEALKTSEKAKQNVYDRTPEGEQASPEDWSNFMNHLHDLNKRPREGENIVLGKTTDPEIKRALERRKKPDFQYKKYEEVW
jgi:hypothetical protein